jgi:hypothetical protein
LTPTVRRNSIWSTDTAISRKLLGFVLGNRTKASKLLKSSCKNTRFDNLAQSNNVEPYFYGDQNIMKQLSFFEIEDRPKMTYTQLATFLRCPLEYKLRFIDKEMWAAPFGMEVLWGRLLHNIARQYLSLPIDQRSTRFLISRLEEETKSRSLPDRDYQLDIFLNPMKSFHHIFAQRKVHSLEIPFKTAFHGFILTGRADCILEGPNGLILFEFKYSDYRESDYNSELSRYLQLIFYSLGLKGGGLKPAEGAYYFFNSGNMDLITLSRSLINRGEKHLMEIIDRISKTNDFGPRANRLCPTCGYRKRCPLYVQRRK